MSVILNTFTLLHALETGSEITIPCGNPTGSYTGIVTGLVRGNKNPDHVSHGLSLYRLRKGLIPISSLGLLTPDTN
jgi:hypothetical protein